MAPHRSSDPIADLPLDQKLQRLRAAFVGEVGYVDVPWLSAAEVETLIAGVAALRASAAPPADTMWNGWLVLRKRETDPWEVYTFDRYDEGAMFFDVSQQQWSETYFCRVAYGPGKPIQNVPAYRVVAAAVAVPPAEPGRER